MNGAKRIAWYGMGGIFFTLLWVATFQLPVVGGVGLDPSWRVVLGRAVDSGIQFGPDLVFTAGPLGFLTNGTFDGIHFKSLLAWQVVLATTGCWLVLRTIRLLSGREGAVLAATVVLFLLPDHEIYFWFLLLASVVLLAHESGEKNYVPTALIGALWGFLALTKFTLLAVEIFASLVVVWPGFTRRQGRHGMVFGGTFLGVFLVGWMLSGQNPFHLGSYLWSSVQVTAGYNEAMAVSGTDADLITGLVVLGLSAALVACTVVETDCRSVAWVRFAGLLGLVALCWKQSFVRADGHQLLFFSFMMGVAVVFGVFEQKNSRQRWVTRGLRLGIYGASILGIGFTLPGALRGRPTLWVGRVEENARAFAGVSSLESDYRQRWAEECEKYRLPFTQKIVGPASVDMVGYRQSLIFYNELNYRPRPVFQSYSAYSDSLLQLNEKFYASGQAPDFALQTFETINERFPSLDDAGVLRMLFRDYQFVREEQFKLLWQRRPEAAHLPLAEGMIGKAGTVRFGEWFSFPDLSKQNLWIRAEYQPTWLGRIVGLLYKLPVVQMEVREVGGEKSGFRMLRAVAAHGFLLNPYWRDQHELLSFLHGGSARRLESIRFIRPEPNRWLYQPEIKIVLEQLPDPLIRKAASDETIVAAGFENLPSALHAFADTSAITLHDSPMLNTHAPAEIEFKVDAPAEAISGQFGFVDGAWEKESGHTAGAEFRVVWDSANYKGQVLFQQRLNPFANPTDRGIHPFRVNLIGLGEGRVRLVTDDLGNNSFGWTCWGGVKITPALNAGELRGDTLPRDSIWVRYGDFKVLPTRASAKFGLGLHAVGHTTAVMVHAPGSLEFSVPTDAHSISASFGLPEEAYQSKEQEKGDGVTFLVVAEIDGKSRELFRRHLNPRHRPEDCGLKSLQIDLKGLPVKKLFLMTDPGPANNWSYDWSCWSSVDIN